MAIVLLVLAVICLSAGEGDREPASWGKLCETAEARWEQGDFDAARASAARGFTYWEANRESPWRERFRLILAEALLDSKRVEEAARLLAPPPREARWKGRWLADRAIASRRLNRPDEAWQHLREAEQLDLRHDPQTAGKIQLLAGMLELNGPHFDAAEERFRRALTFVGNSGSTVACYALTNLGLVSLRQFRYHEAVLRFSEAARAAQQGGKQSAAALAAGNLGATYYWLGDLELADRFLREGVEIATASGDRVNRRRWLVVLGEIHHARHEYAKAAQYYDQARALARGEPDGWDFSATFDRSQLALDTGDLDGAEKLSREALGLAQKVREADIMNRWLLVAAQIAVARKDAAGAETGFRQAIEASAQAKDTLTRRQAHEGLAALYRAQGRVVDAGREYGQAIQAIDEERANLDGNSLKFTFLEHRIRFYQSYVDFLVEQGQTAHAFAVAESSRARVLAEQLNQPTGGTAPLERIVRATGVVLMSYWLGPQRSLLWVMDTNGLHQFTLPARDWIAAEVDRYDRLIRASGNPRMDKRETGRKLFAALVGDHYRVPEGASVVIVPDGVLHRINFESLLVGAGGRYWVEEASIAVAPSLELIRMAEPPPARRLLLMGDPDFASAEFPRLANVRSEIDMVAERFPDKQVLTGKAANPAAYREARPEGFSVLHFAAHAVAKRDSPLDSAIILSGEGESNRLYARDVMKLPLQADLVTLSACQTAGNRAYSGEGLTGFAWAFLGAGARHVVAGLWDVDDRGTLELMSRFYAAQAGGLTPPQALRVAKLGMLAAGGAYAKPFYWAPFETFTRVVYPRGRG
jgi:CHAT domain-containing protein/tetratricopeptide (TPR) repeat protein